MVVKKDKIQHIRHKPGPLSGERDNALVTKLSLYRRAMENPFFWKKSRDEILAWEPHVRSQEMLRELWRSLASTGESGCGYTSASEDKMGNHLNRPTRWQTGKHSGEKGVSSLVSLSQWKDS